MKEKGKEIRGRGKRKNKEWWQDVRQGKRGNRIQINKNEVENDWPILEQRKEYYWKRVEKEKRGKHSRKKLELRIPLYSLSGSYLGQLIP